MRHISFKHLFVIGFFFSTSVQAGDFTITSTNIVDGGLIPVLYTCDGKNNSPQISWTNPPVKTKSFVLTVIDKDASDFVHWLVYNIPLDKKELAAGETKFANGILLGKNSFDHIQYDGPCPPRGSSHKYDFTLYALDEKLTLKEGADKQSLMDTMQKHILGQSTLSSVYSRWTSE